MAAAKRPYRIKYEKQNGSITTTQVTATSKSEAKNILMMRSDTKRVIAVVEA